MRVRLLAALAIGLFAHAAEARPTRGLPPLAANGHLPPGLHLTDFRELSARYGGTPRREELLSSLRVALKGLRASGLSRVYFGGSFASSKAAPGDVDLLIPRQRDVDWAHVVRIAKKTAAQDLHYYGARKIVTDVMGRTMTPEQRAAWTIQKPDFVEFFSQNRNGEEVGMVAIDLHTLDAK